MSKSSQPLTSDPTSLAPGFLLLLLCVELLTPYTLFHFSASVLSSTSKLEEGNQVTSSLSSSNPLCKSGRRPNACSMLVLFEFTSEMLSCLLLVGAQLSLKVPTLGCLRSGADCGGLSRVRGLGGSRVEWDLKSYSSYFSRSLIK